MNHDIYVKHADTFINFINASLAKYDYLRRIAHRLYQKCESAFVKPAARYNVRHQRRIFISALLIERSYRTKVKQYNRIK